VAVLRRDRGVGDRWRFAGIELAEPAKTELAGWHTGDPIPRAARVTCWNREDGQTYTATVDLTGDRVAVFDHRPGMQANATQAEWHEADEMLRAHPDMVAALARRGLTDLDLVLFDTWTYGFALIPEQYRDRRVGWADVWYRTAPGANPYAHPVNGLHPVIDLNRMELLDVGDTGPVPEPDVMGEYVPGHIPGYQAREATKPLEITQPEGPSFELDGNLLRWQNWSLRIGFNYREGLVLHQVGYTDTGADAEGESRVRPVAHRMSLAEMVVPYRDTSPEHYRRTAFDIGEWGLGFMTTSLERGCDCLGEIRYLDATLHDAAGEPYQIPNAICLHEEDNGVLWKHVDPQAGTEVRRMRRLVVSFHATVANYEYLVYWRFYADGNIECEVRATGIMVTTHLRPGETAPATIVDTGTYAPFHQHFIVARLDLDVDGTANTVYSCDSEAAPISADNPYGLTLTQRQTPLRTEAEGQQDYRWDTQRTWKVASDERRNRLGTPTAYKLVPGSSFPAMMDPASPVFQRAQVIGHTLWVTPYQSAERWPAGEFCNQSEHDDGLATWTAQNRPIAGADVVLWYVFGVHHITRPEDWPVMPADTVSFWLKPSGFFDRNPALDV
jgi:primary-amine oxidase